MFSEYYADDDAGCGDQEHGTGLRDVGTAGLGSRLSVAIWPRDAEAAHLYAKALEMNARPIFEDPKGALVQVRFILPYCPYRPDEAAVAAVEGIRLYGWMEEVSTGSSEVLKVAHPRGGGGGAPCSHYGPSTSQLEVGEDITLRLHLRSTPYQGQAVPSPAHGIANAAKLLDHSPSQEGDHSEGEGQEVLMLHRIRHFVEQRDDHPLIQHAAETVLTYAKVLEDHPDIVSESVFDDARHETIKFYLAAPSEEKK